MLIKIKLNFEPVLYLFAALELTCSVCAFAVMVSIIAPGRSAGPETGYQNRES